MPRRKRKKKKKRGKLQSRMSSINDHHMTPTSIGGDKYAQSNLVRLKKYRHNGLHQFAGNLDWEHIIKLMQRISRMKRAKSVL